MSSLFPAFSTLAFVNPVADFKAATLSLLSTDVGTYRMYWLLADYLDVLSVLPGNQILSPGFKIKQEDFN